MKRADGAASCTEVGNVAIQLTNLVLDFPASPQVLVFSATIISFPSTVVCTDDEKGALTAVDEAFDDAVDHLDAAVEAAQSQLATLTGVTASPAEIAAVIATDTTPAILLTTPAPENTTPAQMDTTSGLMDTTPGPMDTTSGPMDTTSAPIDTTPATTGADTTTGAATTTGTDTTIGAATTTTAAPTTTTS